MEKAKITLGQAQDIESLKHNYKMTEETIVESCRDRSFFKYKAENIAHMPLDTLIRALYIGYEVEETPEDKVREYHNEQYNYKDHDTQDSSPNAICNVLNMLGIKIDGVNS